MDRFAAADWVMLYVARALASADVTDPVDRVAVLAVVRDRLTGQLDAAVDDSLERGIPYAHLGRLLGVSRQAVRQGHRCRHRDR